MPLLPRILMTITTLTVLLFSYIDRQNRLSYLQLKVPKVTKNLNALKKEISQLEYEIDAFENASNLIEIAQQQEFSQQQHPFVKDILPLEQSCAAAKRPQQATWVHG